MTQRTSELDLYYYHQLLKYLLRDPEIALYYFQELHPDRGIYTMFYCVKEKFPDRCLEAIGEYFHHLKLECELKARQKKYLSELAKQRMIKLKKPEFLR